MVDQIGAVESVKAASDIVSTLLMGEICLPGATLIGATVRADFRQGRVHQRGVGLAARIAQQVPGAGRYALDSVHSTPV